MNARRAAARWRLALLAAGVLVIHLLLLRTAPVQLRPGKDPPLRFATRTMLPPAPPVAVAPPPSAAPAVVQPAPAPPAVVQPVPAPRPRIQRPRLAPPPSSEAAPIADQTPAHETQTRPAAPSPSTPQAFSLPAPARLRYQVSAQVRGLTLAGDAQLQWRHDGTHYEASLEVSGAGGLARRRQRSEGRITDQGLAPSYFVDKTRSEQATHFDRDTGRVVFSNNRPQADLQAGLQDRLSVIVQLVALVAGQPARFAAGTQIAIPTASVREVDTWIFSVEGEEDLRLPGGELRALKLQRLPRRDYDQKVELWLAPGMDYAPVRLRLTNPNGDAVDQRWSATDKD